MYSASVGNKWAWLYWFVLVAAGLSLGRYRLNDIVEESPTLFDTALLLVIVALLLVPLFKEVDVWGLRLKKQVDKLGMELMQTKLELTSEINNKLSVAVNTAPVFNLNPLPPELLETLQVQVDELTESFATLQKKPGAVTQSSKLTDEEMSLIEIRVHLERELRRLWTPRFQNGNQRVIVGIDRMLQDLVAAEVFEIGLSILLREIYAITSAAIHSRDLDIAQIEFARDNGLVALDILRQSR